MCGAAGTRNSHKQLYIHEIAIVFDELFQIGVKPILAGSAVIVIGLVVGLGISAHRGFFFVRAVRWYVERVVLRALRGRGWTGRALFIFLNNCLVCGAMVAAGMLPGGSWTAIILVGLSMGVAIRALSELDDEHQTAQDKQAADGKGGQDVAAWMGMILNLIELPAIVLTLGLSMGRLAAVNHLADAEVWSVFVRWVIPALALGACGEALWMCRLGVLDSPSSESPSSSSSSSSSASRPDSFQ